LGCWKKGCTVFSGAERNTMRRACLAIRSRAEAAAAGRGGPHEEYRIDAVQASIKGLGKCEIAVDHIDV
jgi:hypothetical protein